MSHTRILKEVFGYPSFRDGQKEIIEATLNGKDVLGIMPTGAGKSLCYQVPALDLEGIAIVISPLISLMQDQVMSLKEVGVRAAYLNSSLNEAQFEKAIYNAKQGLYKIIYVAPERLETASFRQLAKSIDISMVVIDEAHCISQWGQDFRPSYLNIMKFVEQLDKRPRIAAYTATATKQVIDDIVCTLSLKNPYKAITGYDRKNLYFEVRNPQRKKEALLQILKERKNTSGIIYCNTRKNVDEIYEMLEKHGYAVARYHAGLSDHIRATSQQDFIYERKPIIVATNAFGMGIDKSNVRFVVHYNMPKDIESYYQEAGRAGRDGDKADCILLYSGQDVRTNEFIIKLSNEESTYDEETAKQLLAQDLERLKTMTYYCYTNECLRSYILKYFNDKAKSYCGNCSNCLHEFETIDASQDATKIVQLTHNCGERYGVVAIAETAKGSKNKKILDFRLDTNEYYGCLKTFTMQRIRLLMNELLVKGYLKIEGNDYPILKVTQMGLELIHNQDMKEPIILKLPKEKEEKQKRQSMPKISNYDSKLFENLRQLRLEIAKAEQVPPYIVFGDQTLKGMCQLLPTTKEEMLQVTGVGNIKYSKYGEQFLKQILAYKQ